MMLVFIYICALMWTQYTAYLWLPYVIGQTIMFLPCGFFLSIFFSFLA